MNLEEKPESVPDLERIARLTREEVDALPYGLMIFDHAGTVHLYNDYESRLSRRSPSDVLGRNWFHEVAPCTRVAAFEGRYRDFVERGDEAEVARFDFRFHFLHGAQDVVVSFAHVPAQARVFVIVTRRELSESGQPLDHVEPVTVDTADGRAQGGLGSALAAPRIFWSTAFDLIATEPALAAAVSRGAKAWGCALVDALETLAFRDHGHPLSQLPPALAASLADDAIAAQGLGRVELDLGAAAHHIVGVTVRGVDLPTDLGERIYADVLRPVVVALTGREASLVLFARMGPLLRFVATTDEQAAAIADWLREGLDGKTIAKKLGLEAW